MVKWAILDVGLASDIVLQLHLILSHRGRQALLEPRPGIKRVFSKRTFRQNSGSKKEGAWKEKS
jgi:hypothetical protein